MNTRLLQLSYLADETHEEEDKFWFQKYGELILQEVIAALDQDDGATHHRQLLLSHFGVESSTTSTVSDKENIYNLPNSYIEVTEQEEEEFRSLEARSR